MDINRITLTSEQYRWMTYMMTYSQNHPDVWIIDTVLRKRYVANEELKIQVIISPWNGEIESVEIITWD